MQTTANPAAASHKHHQQFGPFEIEWEYKGSKVEVWIKVKYMGISATLIHVVLDAANPHVTVGTVVKVLGEAFGVAGTLSVDWIALALAVDLKFTAFNKTTHVDFTVPLEDAAAAVRA